MSDEVSDEDERRSDNALGTLLDNIDKHPFGIITQHGYQELESRFHRWFIIGLVAFAVISLSSAIALIGYGILLTKQGNITNRIQQQRYDSLLEACLDQNERHDNVVAQIDKAVAEAPPPPPKKIREKQVKPFKLILEAAVPHTNDCRALANTRVAGGP